MKVVGSIGPWLGDLSNPPPRNTLTLAQKAWRVMLVTVTLITICVLVGVVGSLGCYAWERSREFFSNPPEVRNGLTILAASIAVNALCIFTLLQIKKIDQRLIPKNGARH